MRKHIISVLATILMLLFSTAAFAESDTLSLLQNMASSGAPIDAESYIDYTAETDPNGHIGTEGTYYAKSDCTVGGAFCTVEAFKNSTDAAARYEYIDSVYDIYPSLEENMFMRDTYVIRFSADISSENLTLSFKAFERVLSAADKTTYRTITPLLPEDATSTNTKPSIEFMDIPWDQSAYEYITDVRMNLGLNEGNPAIDDFYSIADNSVVLEILDNVESGCGYRIDIFPHLEAPRKVFYVAGYPVMCVTAYTLFDVRDGYVNDSPISSHVAEIKYILDSDRIIDGNATVEDLVTKLTTLYGDYESKTVESDPEDGSVWHRYKWEGEESFVALNASINSDNSVGFAQIIYGIDYAQELIDYIRHPELTATDTVPDIGVDPDNSDNL